MTNIKIKENYGPFLKGDIRNVERQGYDWTIIKSKGKQYYVPKIFVDYEFDYDDEQEEEEFDFLNVEELQGEIL
jgi:hypothetical protein